MFCLLSLALLLPLHRAHTLLSLVASLLEPIALWRLLATRSHAQAWPLVLVLFTTPLYHTARIIARRILREHPSPLLSLLSQSSTTPLSLPPSCNAVVAAYAVHTRQAHVAQSAADTARNSPARFFPHISTALYDLPAPQTQKPDAPAHPHPPPHVTQRPPGRPRCYPRRPAPTSVASRMPPHSHPLPKGAAAIPARGHAPFGRRPGRGVRMALGAGTREGPWGLKGDPQRAAALRDSHAFPGRDGSA